MPIRKSGLNYVTEVINSRCGMEVWLWPSLLFPCVLSHSVVSNSLQPHGLHPARLLCPWDSPGKNTGVSCHALLQGILPIQGSNPGIPHCREMFYHLSHQGRPNVSLPNGFNKLPMDNMRRQIRIYIKDKNWVILWLIPEKICLCNTLETLTDHTPSLNHLLGRDRLMIP